MTGNPLLDSDEYARLLSPQVASEARRTTHDTDQELCPACECPFYEKLYRVRDDSGAARTEQGFWLVQCDNCRLIRLFPWPTPLAPKLAEAASLPGWIPGWHWAFRSHLKFLDETIAHVEGAGILLSANGTCTPLLQLLQQHSLPVVALDTTTDCLSRAWHEGRVPSVAANLLQPPLRAGSCGLILLMNVLEYVPDPAAYLRAADWLLQPAGRLVVQASNIASWQFLWRGAQWQGIDAPRRLFHFRVRELQLLLESCGFEVVRESHFTWRDSPAMLASSLAPKLDPQVRWRRGEPESRFKRTWRSTLYGVLWIAVTPFALLEALAFSGGTVLLEARKIVPVREEKGNNNGT